MKDISHHMKHIQKKVLQAARKEQNLSKKGVNRDFNDGVSKQQKISTNDQK